MAYSFFTGAACGLLLLAAVRISIGHKRRDSRWLVVLLLGIFCYLLGPLLSDQNFHVRLLVSLPTILIPGTFWLFTHQLCSDQEAFPKWGWGIIAVGLAIDFASQLNLHHFFYLFAQPFKLGLIGAGLATLLQQLQSDLVAERRQLRITLLIAIGGYMLIVVCAEFLFSFLPTPAGIPTLHAVTATLLAFGACFWLLSLSPKALEDSLPPASHVPEIDEAPEKTLEPLDEPQRQLLVRLQDHMAAGGYRHTGLTIRELAEQLDAKEHVLRALINKHLGFRNFNEYLNQYRIDEASQRLADPDEAHLPVLSIALDIGYRSLSPFNAAFKRRHEKTPTEFRREALPS
ncbi:helix-turn-helix transcriptional regulator [Microbulbifer agarilyticus]|uniref:helix-turn-helix domain-containing protein n=1 Tax=Microbulbifer agarilyticus TaxID=260552 RepID=UPI001C95BED2|nr:helix-turn-helix transcriptional regulator [Microbulbifer agarilyticus]MBY6191590.1 helix-turn-helix transcriptional regulator [Microbulbifer agarilyticus]